MSGFLSTLLSLLKIGLVLGVLGTLFVISGYMGVQWALSAEEFDVPDVKGMELDEAMGLLTQNGLIVEIHPDRLTDQEVPWGHVLLQNPLAGTAIKRQRGIQLTLSSGPPRRAVPMTVGTALQHARISLQQQNVGVESVARVYSAAFAKDRVIAQQPTTTDLLEGEVVDARLLVSLGPQPTKYVMPDLAYRSVGEIRMQLESLGFQVRVRNHGAVVRGLSADTIIRHVPSPGFPVSKGEPITLYRNQ